MLAISISYSIISGFCIRNKAFRASICLFGLIHVPQKKSYWTLEVVSMVTVMSLVSLVRAVAFLPEKGNTANFRIGTSTYDLVCFWVSIWLTALSNQADNSRLQNLMCAEGCEVCTTTHAPLSEQYLQNAISALDDCPRPIPGRQDFVVEHPIKIA
jgi:hypothetical protein